jgi:hypothetical protein
MNFEQAREFPMKTHQDKEERSPEQERLSRREALKDAAKLGLLLYCVPQVLSSEAVLAQSSPSTAATAGGGGDSSGLAYLGLLPLAGLPFLGGAGAAAAAAGVAPAVVPATLFGIPLANASAPPLIGLTDTPLLDPTRGRGTLPPRPFNRVRRNRVGGGSGGGSRTRDNRVKRAIRGLG